MGTYFPYKRDCNFAVYEIGAKIESSNTPEIPTGWSGIFTEQEKDSFFESIANNTHIPQNYECLNIEHFKYALSVADVLEYRKWRLALKSFVESLATSEQSGFDMLNNSEKTFCAIHNIGNGEQRRVALNDLDRDRACFNYISINEGVIDGALKNIGGAWFKAMCFSRLDHIQVVGINSMSLAVYVLMQLQIQSNTELEMSGNLLDFYRSQGIDGLALGTAPLGISDFIQCTEGTRYEHVGLRTNPIIQSSVSENIVGVSGFKDVNSFADELLYIIKFGMPSYL